MLDVAGLGRQIRKLRKERGLTQSQFAEEICVSFQAVSNWERGLVPPDLENLIAIAAYFEVLVDDLLRPAREDLYLGVDGGGTKTQFVVTDRHGQVFCSLMKQGCNPNDIGLEQTELLLEEGIREILLRFPTVQCAYLGIAGAGVGDYAQRLTRMLENRFPFLKITVQRDVCNLLAMEDGAQMAVISGTGSVVFLRDENRQIRLGGGGYFFDRAGSAFDIGRDAITAALDEEDQKLPESILHRLLCDHLEVKTIWDAVDRLYAGGRREIAALAAIVFDAMAQGDPAATDIVEASAKRLGQLLEIGIRRYGAAPLAITGGGLFAHHFQVFSQLIGKYTDCRLLSCTLPPVYGACRESYRLSGNEPPEDFYNNFVNSYKEG